MGSFESVHEIGKRAKAAAGILASLPAEVKDNALFRAADALEIETNAILSANAVDFENAKNGGMTGALLDRLMLDRNRVCQMAEGLRAVAKLADPVGEVIQSWNRPNGLQINKVRVPIGVIGIIYEARPNVTADAAGLCLKAGNACILRGGSEAIESNKAIAGIMASAAEEAGVPKSAIQLIETTDRESAAELMRMNDCVDALIPRGGAGLIRKVVETATVPVIETGVGNCHVYVDAAADLDMAHNIVMNAKTQRPGVCNAMETLLVDEKVAEKFLPMMLDSLARAGVEIRGCEKTRVLWQAAAPASEDDYYAEFLALVLAVKVVSGVGEAVEHIAKYGTKHSETIVTNDSEAARFFEQNVDAAVVYVNASTRFTDGFEFGFGAELGISTQKLHARGPMGLAEITTYKYVVRGSGQVRV